VNRLPLRSQHAHLRLLDIELILKTPDLSLLALQFVQDHGSQQLILHSLNLAVRRTGYEVRI
jgi:hypothetical protein